MEQRRPTWIVAAVIVVQFTVPIFGQALYHVGGLYTSFGWMMWSVM